MCLWIVVKISGINFSSSAVKLAGNLTRVIAEVRFMHFILLHGLHFNTNVLSFCFFFSLQISTCRWIACWIWQPTTRHSYDWLPWWRRMPFETQWCSTLIDMVSVLLPAQPVSGLALTTIFAQWLSQCCAQWCKPGFAIVLSWTGRVWD